MSFLKGVWEIMAFVVDACIILERTSKGNGFDGRSDLSDDGIYGDS
jgi:hypothetical protein